MHMIIIYNIRYRITKKQKEKSKMKKEITYVPKDQDLMKFLKEKFERGKFKNAWIFVDEGIYKEMLRLVKDRYIRNSSEWCSHIGEWFLLKDFILTKDEKVGNQIWIANDEQYQQGADPEHVFFFRRSKEMK